MTIPRCSSCSSVLILREVDTGRCRWCARSRELASLDPLEGEGTAVEVTRSRTVVVRQPTELERIEAALASSPPLANAPADLPDPDASPYPLMRQDRRDAPLWVLLVYLVRVLIWRARARWRKT